MKDRLMVVETRQGYTLQWNLGDEDDMGATLGECEDRKSLHKLEQDFKSGKVAEVDKEHVAATLAAWKHEDVQYSTYDRDGFYWETKAGATQALRLANIAIKELKDNKPWPDWAKQAAAHGWKPPKGWQP
jgi:hypothetical protein